MDDRPVLPEEEGTTHPGSDAPTIHEPEFYPPPAHLAARFYRSRAMTRRKSSAASSRRNSLSSVHSRTSSLSRRRSSVPGCQSNHIAQHLRRASIIESRKARLADRAAHAEQVRLRAALVKATPRGNNSNSEERALAAQLAKEKYLARVAATCAEEVARAKRIAEEVKERKLAAETRVRMEMEERHAEVEKRRLEYQRNLSARRARRADSAEKKLAVVEELGDVDEEVVVEDEPDAAGTLDPESATLRLQRAWRSSRRRAIVRAYSALDITLARAGEKSFEDMTAFVAEAKRIGTTTAILTHLGLQDANDQNAALNTRTFLSAYMLICHPVTVLNNKNGAQEQDLIAKATDLLQQFESTISRLAPWNNYSPTATALETLSQAYSTYTSAFAAWRLQDSSVLIEGMVASFVELDAIWQTVKDDSRGEVANDYREGIRDNQVMLLSRIRKLAGVDKAEFLIKKGIRESRKSRLAKNRQRPIGEVRPRGLEAGQQQAPELSDDESSTAVGGAMQTLTSTEQSAENELGKDVTRKLFTIMPSNRIITHELAIDRDFRLSESDTTRRMRDGLARSICDAMKAGFKAGNSALWTVSAAENIRERLLRMFQPGQALHSSISEMLDPEHIARECHAGVFSYDGFFQYMAKVLPKVCAPFRDSEVARLSAFLEGQEPSGGGDDAGLENMIEKLYRMLRTVDMLSLDYTNFMLMNAAPTLLRDAAGYEQRQFSNDLASGRASLERTHTWLDAARGALLAEADRRDPEGLRNPADRPNGLKVYVHALVSSALGQGPLKDEEVAETLALDVERLRDSRDKALRITVIGAVLLTAKNLLRRDARTQWKNEAGRLWTLLSAEGFAGQSDSQTSEETSTTAQKAFAIIDSAHNMPPATKQQLSGTIHRFFTQAATSRLTDPVLKVLHQRLRTHILTRLSATTAAERVRAASSASEALTSIGLGECLAQVGAMVDLLERVRAVDWRAHGQWYQQIFGEMGL